MRYAFWMLCLAFQSLASGQAEMVVDHVKIRIGDQLHATVSMLSTMGGEWVNQDKMWPDSMKGIEVVSGPVMNKEKTQGTWTLSFFDTGYVRIPPVPLVLRHQGRLDTFYTKDIPIQVEAVEPDSSGLLAIKDIYVHPFNILYYKKYLPHALVALLLLGGLWYWWRKRRKKEAPVVLTPPEPTPHDWAYKALEELAAMRLWQKGEVKEHYSLLTGILREYLERRFRIRALEQTSEEIIDQLQSLNLSKGTLEDTESLLSISDLIKFAKADPGVDIHADAIERVKAFIKETTIASMAEVSNNNAQPL
ncbi:MAG TPA: hypothetical protein VJ508_11760 [Saprospiraceae bacterium]|nr:hypothetical protein [Saprospiraceae bacterium]